MTFEPVTPALNRAIAAILSDYPTAQILLNCDAGKICGIEIAKAKVPPERIR